MTIEVEKVDDVPQHGRSLDTAFHSPTGHKVAAEAARFLHLLKLGVDDTRAVSM